MAGLSIGRRVEIVSDGKNGEEGRFDGVIFDIENSEAPLLGRCGTILAVTKNKKLQILLDNGLQVRLRRRDLKRPFISSFENRMRKALQPPSPQRTTFEMNLEDHSGLGLEADLSTLLITHVKPRGRAWAANVRAGFYLVGVNETRVKTVLEAKQAIFACRKRGDVSCNIAVEKPGVAASMVGF